MKSPVSILAPIALIGALASLACVINRSTTTDNYSIDLTIQDAGSVDRSAFAQMPGTPSVRVTDQGQPVNYFLLVQIHNRETLTVVSGAAPAITITNQATGESRALAEVVAMYEVSKGPEALLFGNNVYLSEGQHTVTVAVGQDTAVFRDLEIGSVAEQPASRQPSASAQLRNAAGQVVGTATFSEDSGGVTIRVQVSGLPAGDHGIHLHAVGRCDPPDFTSAGGHFNPSGKQHGLQNPQGSHEGDLPGLTVGADGTANYSATTQRVTLRPDNVTSLFHEGGTALVIHADPDDQRTDPTGNSGSRIACGVIAPS